MAGTYELPYTGNQVEILLGKVSQLEAAMPTKVSDLTNDTGFITAASLPTKTSDLINDSGFITSAAVPTKVSQLQNDSSFATTNQLGTETSRAQGVEGGLRTDVDAINAKIPSAAAANNQLADKAFVNSSISTASATFRGTYTSLADLQAVTADENDYGFVTSTDAAGNTVYNRYKYASGTWTFEYELNNSSFTAAQWAAINSAITAALVEKLTALPTNTDLQTALSSKYVKPGTGIPATDLAPAVQTSLGKADSAYQKPGTGIPKTDLSSDVQTSLGKADTAIQDVSGKADKDTDAVTGNIAEFDASGNPVDSGLAKDDIAKKDGWYQGMTVGLAENLVDTKGDGTEQEFTLRTACGDESIADDGSAVIKEIRGKSLVWNQILRNGNFVNVGQWGTSMVSYSVDNGVATITPNSNNAGVKSIFQNSSTLALASGHKYYYSGVVKPGNSGYYAGVGFFNTSSGSNISIARNETTEYKRVSGIYAYEGTGVFGVRGSNGMQTTEHFYAKDVFLIDLTLMFGAGNEPSSAAEFEKLFTENHYAYSANKIISNCITGIKTVGFNAYNPETGKAYVLSGNQYQITGTYTSLSLDGAAITPDENGLFTPTTNGELVVTGGGSDTCVHLTWSGYRNGEYEPYWEAVRNIPITTVTGKLNGEGESVVIVPDGLKSVGSTYDYGIVENGMLTKIVRRVAAANMGNLTWIYKTSGTGTSAGPYFYTKQTSGITNSRVLCEKYPEVTTVSAFITDKIITGASMADSKTISVRDSNYSSTADFETAVSGVMLYFEYATPRTYVLDEPIPMSYKVADFGTEEILPAGVDANGVPASVPFRAVIKYNDDFTREIVNLPNKYAGKNVETVLEHKADIDGNYPLLTSGSAQNLVGRGTVEAEFTKRTSGGDADIGSGTAQIERIKGKSIVWNELADNATDRWTNYGSYSQHSLSNGVLTVKRKSTTTNAVVAYIEIEKNSKYYFAFTFRRVTASIAKFGVFQTGMSDSSATIVISTTSTDWVREKAVVSVGNNIMTGFKSGTQYDEGGTTVEVKDIIFLNLTKIFGAGNEPTTVEQVESFYPLLQYDYDPGTMKNVVATGLETIGFNLYDPESGKAQLLGGQTNGYQITGAYSALSFTGVSGTTSTITPDENGAFNVTEAGELTVTEGDDTTTCVHLVWSGYRNGEYESYWKSRLDISITTLTGKLNGEGDSSVIFPDGLKGVGNVFDEISQEKAVKRMFEVDLSTLTWTTAKTGSTKTAKYATLPNSYPYKESSQYASGFAIAENYNIIGGTSSALIDQAGGVDSMTNGLYFWGGDATSASSVYIIGPTSSWAATGKLVYPLYTPKTYVLDEELTLSYRVDDFGTEECLPADTSAAVTAPLRFDVKYAMNAVDTIRRLPENYISKESMQAFLSTLGTAMNGTWTMTWNSETGQYGFTFTENEQSE